MTGPEPVQASPRTSSIRGIVVPLAVILATALVVWPMRSAFDGFIESRSFASPMTWALGMTWAFDFAWSAILGALLGAVMHARSAILWAAAAGIAYGAVNFALTQHHFSPSLTWTLYAWIYGQYLVSFVGGVAGAWIALGVFGDPAAKERSAA